MAQTYDKEAFEAVTASLNGVMGAFEAEINSNQLAAIERIRTCEKNVKTHRQMLNSDSYTFDQKREIRDWMEQEKAQQAAIDQQRHERDQESLSTVLLFGSLTVIVVTSVIDPLIGKKFAKKIPSLFPKAAKMLKAA